MQKFELDERLARDSLLVVDLGLCQLRLMNDKRWTWLILVPQRAAIAEVFELAPLDQTMLTFETGLVASALKKSTACTKVNIAAIGNIVRQLHIHVIARNEGDANWPGPVWGFGKAEPYTNAEKQTVIDTIIKALSA